MSFNNDFDSDTDSDTDYNEEHPSLIRRNAEHPSYHNNTSNINANNNEDEILQQVIEQSKVEFENEIKPPDNFEYFYQVQPLSHYPWHNIQH